MRVLLAVCAFALIGSNFALAQDRRPPQPVPPRALPVQPARPAVALAPRTIDRLQEEVESLAAHRETKTAYVKAAAIELEGAKMSVKLLAAQRQAGTLTESEFERAKLAVAAAEAQLQIRECELREVEVKLKFAKKRLESATAPPAPPLRPAPRAVPAPDRPGATDMSKVRIAELEAEVAQAEAEVAVSQAELVRIRNIAQLGRVRAGTIEAAEAKVAAAQAKLEKAKVALAEVKAASRR